MLKLGIAVTAALYGFVGQLRSAQIVSALDVQIPPAELFLWVKFLHSLHLPSRRDLMFSLAASLGIDRAGEDHVRRVLETHRR